MWIPKYTAFLAQIESWFAYDGHMYEKNSYAPYGMEYTSRSDLADLMTKNNFTTEAPISFLMYIDEVLKKPTVLIEGILNDKKQLSTHQAYVPLAEVFGADPCNVGFRFEESFEGYDKYATNKANRSDVVVVDRETGGHKSAFEVKLVVVPNSGTARKSHDDQSCEIVVRPPSIEQLTFSIADTYGKTGMEELRKIIVKFLGDSIQYFKWEDESFMLRRLPQIREAAEAIAKAKLAQQKPFAITGLWRTQGQRGLLDENCFDSFVWTNLAFLQLFLVSAANRNDPNAEITRPERSLIWLVRSLYDYACQGKVKFDWAHSAITYNQQTDKAGSFAGNIPFQFMNGPRLRKPAIPRDQLDDVIPMEALDLFMPERRLDATLFYGAQIEKAREFGKNQPNRHGAEN